MSLGWGIPISGRMGPFSSSGNRDWCAWLQETGSVIVGHLDQDDINTMILLNLLFLRRRQGGRPPPVPAPVFRPLFGRRR